MNIKLITLIPFILLAQQILPQDIYQEGRGFYINISSFGLSIGKKYDNLGFTGQLSFRITDRFDAGIVLGNTTFNQTPENPDLDYTSNEFTTGAVLGYSIHPNRFSWGVRFSMVMGVTIQTVNGGQYVADARSHIYNGQFKTFLFKQIDLGNSTHMYPGIGLNVSFSHTTVDPNETPGSENRFILGIFAKLPLSISVSRKNRLIIEPVFQLTSQGSVSGLNLKFSFGK